MGRAFDGFYDRVGLRTRVRRLLQYDRVDRNPNRATCTAIDPFSTSSAASDAGAW